MGRIATFFAVLLSAAMIFAITYGIHITNERANHCREAGGVPYNNGSICLNPSAIVEVY